MNKELSFEELMKDPRWVKIYESLKREDELNKKYGVQIDLKKMFNDEIKRIEAENAEGK